ncbi:MAG: HPF/RaiA family ribosome-associated protein [Anaerolineae bacterium]
MIDQLMAPDIDLTDADRQTIARKVAKLDKLLTHWDDDTVWIRVALRQDQARNRTTHALISVGIPGATLVTEDSGASPTEAVSHAVDEMERELRKRKTRYEQKRRAPSVGRAMATEMANEPEEEDYAPPAEP